MEKKRRKWRFFKWRSRKNKERGRKERQTNMRRFRKKRMRKCGTRFFLMFFFRYAKYTKFVCIYN